MILNRHELRVFTKRHMDYRVRRSVSSFYCSTRQALAETISPTSFSPRSHHHANDRLGPDDRRRDRVPLRLPWRHRCDPGCHPPGRTSGLKRDARRRNVRLTYSWELTCRNAKPAGVNRRAAL